MVPAEFYNIWKGRVLWVEFLYLFVKRFFEVQFFFLPMSDAFCPGEEDSTAKNKQLASFRLERDNVSIE